MNYFIFKEISKDRAARLALEGSNEQSLQFWRSLNDRNIILFIALLLLINMVKFICIKIKNYDEV